MKKILFVVSVACVVLLTSCLGSRYVSADRDLEGVYLGKTYYNIVGEFGYPSITLNDHRNGTLAEYDAATLKGTSAERLYGQYQVRNRRTKEKGTPATTLRFYFTEDMRCYAVESDLQLRRVKETAPGAERVYSRNELKPIVPRTLNFPHYDACSPAAEVVRIERIVVEKGSTTVYFGYSPRTPKHRPTVDKGICVHPDIFLRDNATGEHYKMTKVEGITQYPEYTNFSFNKGGYDIQIYSVTFEALPIEVRNIDIVEPGAEGFNFYGVDVRTPMTPREEAVNKR